MNTTNIKVGDTIKNYKALCDLLEVKPVSGGRNRKNQEKKLKYFFNWKKDGYKYIITEIKENNITWEEVEDIIHQNSAYTSLVKAGIVGFLYYSPTRHNILSVSSIIENICLVNKNYNKGRNKVSKVAKLMTEETSDLYGWFGENQKSFKESTFT